MSLDVTPSTMMAQMKVLFCGAWEYVAGENGHRLDGSIIHLSDMFGPEKENKSMQHLCTTTAVMLLSS